MPVRCLQAQRQKASLCNGAGGGQWQKKPKPSSPACGGNY